MVGSQKLNKHKEKAIITQRKRCIIKEMELSHNICPKSEQFYIVIIVFDAGYSFNQKLCYSYIGKLERERDGYV